MPKSTDSVLSDDPAEPDAEEPTTDAVLVDDLAPEEPNADDASGTKPVEEGDSIEHPIDAPAAAVDDPGPTPITPASSAQQYEDRISYENLVNGRYAEWIEANRAAVLATLLAGGTVELTHTLPDADDTDGAPGTVGDADSTITPKS